MALKRTIKFTKNQDGVCALSNYNGALRIEFAEDVTIEDAYIQVKACNISKLEDGSYTAQAVVWVVDEQTKLPIGPVVQINNLDVDVSKDVVKQVYDHIKTLTPLKGAEDC